MTSVAGDDNVAYFEFDQADRMKLCLRRTGVGVAEVAEYLGVNRVTVGNWINGHTNPSGPVLKLWAMRFGVSEDWLKKGELPPPTTPDGEPPVGFEPTTYRLEGQHSSNVVTFPRRDQPRQKRAA